MAVTASLGSRLAGAVVALLVPLVLAAPAHAAQADSKHGLYGTQDPTYDGTFRQSLAILALQAAGEQVPPAAIDWLVTQQCADGGWTPYRKDTGKPCVKKSEDSNSTAMAVQALAALGGQSGQVAKAVDWLTAQQNDDGGVGYNPGGASDANSTALFVQALAAAGHDPADSKAAGKSPVDGLLGLQLGCSADAAERGAFAFQAKGGKAASDLATTAALFALSGKVLPVTRPGGDEPKTLPCGGGKASRTDSAPAAAAHLDRVMGKHKWSVPAQQGKGSDWGTTASAVIALSALGDTESAGKAMDALAKNVSVYTKGPDGKDAPASLANLVLASVATGRNPAKVAGGAATRLAATGPKPPAALKPRAANRKAASGGAVGNDRNGGGTGSWVAVGVIGAVVLIGVLVLLNRREEAS